MSFREKHLWISIAATVGVWGEYFWRLIGVVRAGGLASPDFASDMGGLFFSRLALVVAVEVGLTILATLMTRQAEREARDEREMTAALQASHVSLMLLIVLVVTVAVGVYGAALLTPGLLSGVVSVRNALALAANVLIGCVVLSELTRFVFTLALIRRVR